MEFKTVELLLPLEKCDVLLFCELESYKTKSHCILSLKHN